MATASQLFIEEISFTLALNSAKQTPWRDGGRPLRRNVLNGQQLPGMWRPGYQGKIRGIWLTGAAEK
jgi:hypothetical protein